MRIRIFTHVLLLILISNNTGIVFAQEKESGQYPEKRKYFAEQLQGEKPVIDGSFSDPCWQTYGSWSGDFTQQQPRGGEKPSFPTYIKILYDRSNLYVAIKCMDPEPEKIRNTFAARDDFEGDMTGIAIDSYFDQQTAYEFNLSAAGQKVDLMHLGAYQWDFDWNAVWDGATMITDSGWNAELRIPFSQLRYNASDDLTMGIHIWRWIARYQEESQWQLIPIDAPAMVFLFGELHNIRNIQESRQLEVQPYMAASYVPSRSDVIPDKPFRARGGLDAKIGISSNFTLDATINPDFGQVEADPSVLNLTNYEVFYAEKRNFFLEGNNIYDFKLGDDILFYSRRLGHSPLYRPLVSTGEETDMPLNTAILGALKLTGRNKKGLSVGIIESLTAKETAGIYSADTSYEKTVEPMTNYFVGRIKQELNEGNTNIGLMFTSANRLMENSYLANALYRNSLVGGADLLHYWKEKKYAVSGKFVISNVNGSNESIRFLQEDNVHQFLRPDTEHLSYDSTITTLSGTGGELGFQKLGGKWRFSSGFNWRSPGFEMNDLGFLRQADRIGQNTTISYVINDPGKIFRNYSIALSQDVAFSFGGELCENETSLILTGYLNKLWQSSLYFSREFSYFETRELRGGPALYHDPGLSSGITIHSDYAKPFMVFGNTSFDRADNLHSKGTGISGGFRLNVTPKITFTLSSGSYNNRNNSQYINTFDVDGIQNYVVGEMTRKTIDFTLRAQVHFNPELSIQYYGSPYLTIGKFRDIRVVNDPAAKLPDDRFHIYTPDEIRLENNTYFIDMNNDGTDEISFTNPNFNFSQLRSNLVLRWEYKLGSILYLVWTSDKTYSEYRSNWAQSENLRKLNGIKGNNIFMLKFSYWFTI